MVMPGLVGVKLTKFTHFTVTAVLGQNYSDAPGQFEFFRVALKISQNAVN